MGEVLRQQGPNTVSTAPQATSPEIGRLRAMVMAALVAIAPQVSCNSIVESDSYEDDIAETEDSLGVGVINCDVLEAGREWVISGHSNEDFVLKVSEDGQPVFEGAVPAGEFNFQEPIKSPTASKIDRQAFKTDTGEEIKIVDHMPEENEMYGSTICVDLNTLEK